MNFNEIINSEKPVLVDFYATWCGPCKTLSPVLDQMKETYLGKAEIVKIDIDENFELASKYNIRSVPTIMIFKNGEIIKTMNGFQGKAKVEEMLNSTF